MILNDNQEPVHIIMERVTSKTHDAYVEFVTLHDAMKAVEKHSRGPGKGKPSRLGDRPVEVELSSQAMLMKDLFPLAAGIFWDGSKPNIKASTEGEPWNDFKGFITEEEMTMLVKHVEIPQRVSRTLPLLSSPLLPQYSMLLTLLFSCSLLSPANAHSAPSSA